MSTAAAPTKGDLPGDLFDLFVEHPEGMRLSDMERETGAPKAQIRKALRTLRLILSDGDDETLFVTAEPQGAREEWLYVLVDGSALVDAEKSAWAANRVGDAQSRIRLLAKGMAVAVRATDHRTVIGRKAVQIERQLRHLLEDLEAIDVEA